MAMEWWRHTHMQTHTRKEPTALGQVQKPRTDSLELQSAPVPCTHPGGNFCQEHLGRPEPRLTKASSSPVNVPAGAGKLSAHAAATLPTSAGTRVQSTELLAKKRKYTDMQASSASQQTSIHQALSRTLDFQVADAPERQRFLVGVEGVGG